jgi:phage FluMu protein Com
MEERVPRDLRRKDIRCKGCEILLARIDDSGLSFKRSGLQVTVDGHCHVSIVCYRPKCQTLNVVSLATKKALGSRR